MDDISNKQVYPQAVMNSHREVSVTCPEISLFLVAIKMLYLNEDC